MKPTSGAAALAVLFSLLALSTCARSTSARPTMPDPGFLKRVAAIRDTAKAGRFAAAESLGRVLVEEAERRFGSPSLELAAALGARLFGLTQTSRARSVDARSTAERAVAVRESLQGPDHPDVAESLGLLVRVLIAQSKLDSAEVLLTRTLAIVRKQFGPHHSQVARTVGSLSIIEFQRGNFRAAKQRADEALGILDQTPHADSIDVAQVYGEIGQAAIQMDDDSTAKVMIGRAIRIRERVNGPQDPELAPNLNNLAGVHTRTGDYHRALDLYRRATDLETHTRGPDSPGLAIEYENQSWILNTLGDHVGARQTAQRAVEIRKKALGPNHPMIARALRYLADALEGAGDYAMALSVTDSALAINRVSPGRDSLDLARSLENMASLLLDLERPGEARPFFEDALRLRRRAQGATEEHVVWIKGEIAKTCSMDGNYAEAARRWDEVARAQEQQPPYFLAQTLSNLGEMQHHLGHLEEAERLHRRALAICDSVLGPGALRSLAAAGDLASVEYDLGRRATTFGRAVEVERGSREALRQVAGALSEREALGFAAIRATGLNLLLTMASDSIGLGAPARREAWDAVVRSRALVFDVLADRRRSRRGADRTTAALISSLDSARIELARLMVSQWENGPSAEQSGRISAARLAREEAERALGERSAPDRLERSRTSVGLAEIAAALPESSALVAFTRFRRQLAARAPGSAGHVEDSYVAFVMTAGGVNVVAVPIGRASELEPLIYIWRAALATPPIEGAAAALAESRCARLGQDVRRRIWDPLERHLASAARVFIVPDGAIELVSFAALPAGGGRYLVEHGPLVHLLTTERDLLPSEESHSRGHGMLALGGPDFDRVSPSAPPDPALAPLAAAMPLYRSSIPDSDRVRFTPLPGAAREAEEVAALWRTQAGADERAAAAAIALEGGQASESEFKRLAPSREVLHLATHSFRLDRSPPRAGSLSALRGVAGVGASRPGAVPAARAAWRIEDLPLGLSGLALAGANRPPAENGGEDGLLTCEEIMALDLGAADWAVLSACETGGADPQEVESIQGFHRAFRVAGVRTVFMSLWPVEDEDTRVWMSALYRAHRVEHRGAAESVRQASLACLRARRIKHASTHPFHWAAFVASGEWR